MNFNKVDNVLSNLIDENKITGGCFSIYLDGETVYSNQMGYLDINHNKKINSRSIFRLASMTKPITACATLICLERGLIKLDDNIANYLPNFRDMYLGNIENDKIIKGEKIKKPITIKNILTHSSGFGMNKISNMQSSNYFEQNNFIDIKTSVNDYSNFFLEFEPGTKSSYSPFVAFDILARIIEIVTQTKYDEFIKKEILEPLEMIDTSYNYISLDNNRKVSLYSYIDNTLQLAKDVKFGFQKMSNDYTSGGAGLSSTLEDYSHFAEMLANFGEYRDKKILKRETIELMRSKVIDYWGLGVYTRITTDQPLPLKSFGWSGAYGTHFFVYPERKMYAIYMHNSTTFGGSDAIHALDFEKAVINSII